MVEFVSYNGKFPNLCSGTLIIRVNGEEFTLEAPCLQSGGNCGFDEEQNEYIETGDWRLCGLPDSLEQYRDEILKVVNENVPRGCCGGCI